MSEPPPRSLRLRLDREALAGNWRALDRLSGSARAGAAVKADAYGIGVANAVPVLREAGCETFYVAHWSEVTDLLEYAAPEQVVVLHGPIRPDDVAFARETGVRPVINSLYQARLWLDGGGGRCDLMVDTGINRLGLPPGDIGDALVGRLEIETLMSHLASADEDSAQNEAQRRLFENLAQQVPHCQQRRHRAGTRLCF
jgi:alanine racemase